MKSDSCSITLVSINLAELNNHSRSSGSSFSISMRTVPKAWRRSAKGNLTTPLNNGHWGTIFKTAFGDYKYVTRNDFSARSFATEDAAREAAEERWGAA